MAKKRVLSITSWYGVENELDKFDSIPLGKRDVAGLKRLRKELVTERIRMDETISIIDCRLIHRPMKEEKVKSVVNTEPISPSEREFIAEHGRLIDEIETVAMPHSG